MFIATYNKETSTKKANFSKLCLFFCLSLLTCLSLSYLATPSFGSERKLIREEKNLEDVKKKIRARKATVEKIAKKEGSILSELNKINRKLTGIKREIAKLEKRRKGLKKELKKTSNNIIGLKEDQTGLEKRLRKRLRAIYMLRNGTAVKASFMEQESGEPGSRSKLMGLIMESDKRLIGEVEENIKELDNEQERLTGLKQENDKLRVAYKKKQNGAKKEKKKRKSFLSKTRREKSKQSALLKELEGAASELTSLIGKLKKKKTIKGVKSAFEKMKGSLPMPVKKGKVVSAYGKVKHPDYGTITFNNGIVIKAKYGETVESVYEGSVAYVGWLRGYGQVIILAHEGGFYTLYGYLYEVRVERGETITKGAGIGLVGDSGPDGNAALYFEVRQGGVPRDPMTWLASK